VSRKGRRREPERPRVRRVSDLIPIPAHPYRDSAIFYGLLSCALVGVTYATGGGMVKAFVLAGGFFVIATSFSWWRFREKLAERARDASARQTE
jgi:hypothetical protein